MGSAEWLGGVLFVVAMIIMLLAPLIQQVGRVEPLPCLDSAAAHAAGLAAALTAALQLQVRGVEEPYLVRTHGARYLDTLRGQGGFCPGSGPCRAGAAEGTMRAA